MTYATGRLYCDADSHIMEVPDYLTAHADPQYRDRLPRFAMDAEWFTETLGEAIARGAHSPDAVSQMIASGEKIIAGRKDYFALGAFNGGERSRALDLLGFAYQVVLPSLAVQPALHETVPMEIRYAAARASNRAMAQFCAADNRLFGTALLPLDDPAASIEEAEHLIDLGLKAAHIPHRHCGGRPPGHPDLDGIWARLAQAGIAVLMHVGGTPLPFMAATEGQTPLRHSANMLDGGVQKRGTNFRLDSREIEVFLADLIFGGVFERHRKLQAGVIEMGATWVPAMMSRLDAIAEKLRLIGTGKMSRRPSEQIRQQLAFTPSHHEHLGDIIEASDSGLYLFSSDYPHVEGGEDPVGEFEASLAARSENERSQFYAGNFMRLFASAASIAASAGPTMDATRTLHTS